MQTLRRFAIRTQFHFLSVTRIPTVRVTLEHCSSFPKAGRLISDIAMECSSEMQKLTLVCLALKRVVRNKNLDSLSFKPARITIRRLILIIVRAY
jgi:hypothetical protein